MEWIVKERRKKTTGQLIDCARRYDHILERHNALELLSLSIGATTLKWSVCDDMQVFMSMMDNNGNNYSTMLDWLKMIYGNIPKEYGNSPISQRLPA